MTCWLGAHVSLQKHCVKWNLTLIALTLKQNTKNISLVWLWRRSWEDWEIWKGLEGGISSKPNVIIHQGLLWLYQGVQWGYRLTSTKQGRYCCWSCWYGCRCPFLLPQGHGNQLQATPRGLIGSWPPKRAANFSLSALKGSQMQTKSHLHPKAIGGYPKTTGWTEWIPTTKTHCGCMNFSKN